MKKPELLSPAGNFESLKMAVMAGATAVYFGAKNFNARAKADNFGADIFDAVAFAHMYGVKVYLTLNTLVENDEIDELCNTIHLAMQANVDAFIVQDFGVVNILKNCFPDAVIHSSTQMAVNNYLGALKAQEMGISRVVLSRETSLEDIKLIKQKTNLEIEYFIQGALCVCFSGNCYLSSCIFGKSGNRGECLQPCRLPYKAYLKNKQIGSGYLFSAKDINMSKRLKELVECGVDSFKIEGRLRRPAYVYQVTKTYSEILSNNYYVTEQNLNTLKKAFNRGDFCEGYLNGNSNIIDDKIQGHKGVKIGKVVGFNKGQKFNIVTIKSSKINKGDVLKFIKDGVENSIITAIDVKFTNNCHKITTTSTVELGSDVHLILDAQEEELVLKQNIKLPIDFTLYAFSQQKLKLVYSLTYGINTCNQILKGEVEGDECNKAITIALDEKSAMDSLQKLSDTNFYLNNFTLNTNGVFVSKKQLNEIRRNAVENIYKYFNKKQNVIFNKNCLNITKLYSQKMNKKYSLKISNCEENADFLVIKPEDYKKDFSKITHKNAYLYIPAFLPNINLKLIDKILNENPNLGVYAQNIGALNYNRKTILGAKLNIKNAFAVKQLLNKNVTLVETSPELTSENFNQLQKMFDVDFVPSSFDNFELMTFVHCPIKTLFKNDCSNCKYCTNIEYKMQNGVQLVLKRQKLNSCLFTLHKK